MSQSDAGSRLGPDAPTGPWRVEDYQGGYSVVHANGDSWEPLGAIAARTSFYEQAVAVRDALNAVARGTVPGEPCVGCTSLVRDSRCPAHGKLNRPDWPLARGEASESRSVGASDEQLGEWFTGWAATYGHAESPEAEAAVVRDFIKELRALDGVRAGEPYSLMNDLKRKLAAPPVPLTVERLTPIIAYLRAHVGFGSHGDTTDEGWARIIVSQLIPQPEAPHG